METEKKEVEARFKRLQEYLEGPFFMAHEYPTDDPEFEKRVVQLHGLVHELEAATTGGGKRITLKLNTVISSDPCAICGGRCDPDGFDFFIEGTESLVCTDCVRTKAPDLYSIGMDAFAWRANATEAAWQEGEKAGKEKAGRIILAAVEETPVDRVKRVCFAELCVVEDVPF